MLPLIPFLTHRIFGNCEMHKSVFFFFNMWERCLAVMSISISFQVMPSYINNIVNVETYKATEF